ncbi:cytochrome P450 [Aspergillus steynii IBT 23096]|uniref:Cytochrome P450 n=1 Tax=Aspergillus steynii IBT 23096 TaxID=1392250 RepID=A0A2I2GAB4_9EURO|nr:cytochrome P450 [Aspergillus steynii IBT 23096]PLB49817.1 cytochrome P450 [Aspergillus steynii IBT 23096]
MSLFNFILLPLEGSVILLIGYLLVNEFIRWNRRIKGLPGPQGLPVIGNLRQVTQSFSAEQYRQWSEKYGPVYQVQLGNIPVVIVNTADSAKSLFLNQSSALISRPLFHVLHKTVSKSVASIGTSPWDESCKFRRKLAAGALNRPKVQSYEPIILLETREFIQELLQASCENTEVEFKPTVHRLSLNLVLTLNYGTRVSSTKDLQEDALYAEIIEVENEISRFRSTSKNLTNYIPLLRLLEPLLWKKSAAYSAQIGQRRIAYNNKLLNRLKEAVKYDTDKPCIQGNVLRDPESVGLSSKELLSISLSMMAGADSTQPTIAWAILFLAHNQHVQQRAFNEIQRSGAIIDSKVETQEVEYIHVLTKELMRVYTVLPLGMPRETTETVHFEGRAIPPGTMVFLNAYGCNRDGDAFADPWTFKPERWLDNAEKHTHQFAFGYGSRMCIASHLAFRLVYTAIFHLIATFEIHPMHGQSKDAADPVVGLKDPTSITAVPRAEKARLVARELTKRNEN